MSRLLVVSNRLPVTVSAAHGEAVVSPSMGGLATGLRGPFERSQGLWIGWPGDLSRLGDATRAAALEQLDALRTVPVELTGEEVRAYYEDFANGVLWPVFHYLLDRIPLRSTGWDVYRRVNAKFADAVAAHHRPGDVVWVHDYQLLLLPGLLRERLPDARIGFFLHIPFPAQELFLRLPWRAELVDGLLGADVVGFQTAVGADNFRLVARRLLGARLEPRAVVLDGHRTRIGTFPVGIDAARVHEIAARPSTIARAEAIRAELGRPRTVLLGVDRLDYTKGIEVRLRAYRALLEAGRIDPATTVFVQIAQPSRDEAPGYAETRTLVEQMAGSINGDFGSLAAATVKYVHQGQDLDELVALYRAADVMLVTPFRDGMNLVAKEYVAARADLDGVLILSEFAGAAHQLRQAVLVNPFDVRGLEVAIDDAVNGDRRQHRRRMASLRRSVFRDDAGWWARSFLAELEADPTVTGTSGAELVVTP